jgi:hypothetical protein
MLFLQEDVARMKVKEAIEYGLESQRISQELRGYSTNPNAQNIIKATASFAKKLSNWVSQLPCEFRRRFAVSRNAGFSECG